MSKPFNLNAGTAVLIRDSSNTLDAYEGGLINCGSLYVSKQINNLLAERKIAINAGAIRVIDVTGTIVNLGRNAVINGGKDFSDCFLIAEESAILTPEGIDSLNRANALFVTGRFLHPKSFTPVNIYAEEIQAYPDNFIVIQGDFELTEESLNQLRPNTGYHITDTLKLLNSDTVQAIRERGNSLSCNRLFISYDIENDIGALIERRETTVIPEGHTVVTDLDIDKTSPIIYGDKVYVLHDLTCRQANSQYLLAFKSIYARKACIPLSALEQFIKIARAEKIIPFEGEYLSVSDRETLNHSFFDTALKSGYTYTIECKGKLTLDSDVTAEDISCINSIDLYGMLCIPDALRAPLLLKIREKRGIIVSLEESKAREKEKQNASDAQNVQSLNMGCYIMI